MKVLLVNPASEFRGIIFKKPLLRQWCLPPLGLASIAGYLEFKGIDVKILDAHAENLNTDNTIKKILERNPDIVGLTANISTYAIVKELCQKLKKLNKDIITIIGGPFPTTLPKYVLKNDAFDYIILNEGEFSFYNLIKNIELIKLRKIKKEQLKGIAFKHDGRIEINKNVLIKNLDDLPIKAWHMLPLKKYRPSAASFRELPAISNITSRGCPFDCIYCNKEIFGREYRYQSIGKVERELNYLKEKGFKDINFWDDVFTLRKDKFELYKMINDLDLIWNCSTRVDLVNEKIIKTMAKNGCYEIGYGIESCCEKTLKFMRKNVSVEQILKATKLTKKYGIELKVYIMIGFPNETKEDMDKTMKIVRKIDPDVLSIMIVTPFPGTDLFQYANKSLLELDMDNLNYWSGNVLASNLYNFEFLSKYMKKAYREFYLRPDYVLKTLKKMNSFSNIKRYTIAAMSSL